MTTSPLLKATLPSIFAILLAPPRCATFPSGAEHVSTTIASTSKPFSHHGRERATYLCLMRGNAQSAMQMLVQIVSSWMVFSTKLSRSSTHKDCPRQEPLLSTRTAPGSRKWKSATLTACQTVACLTSLRPLPSDAHQHLLKSLTSATETATPYSFPLFILRSARRILCIRLSSCDLLAKRSRCSIWRSFVFRGGDTPMTFSNLTHDYFCWVRIRPAGTCRQTVFYGGA
jgi:hypothetical protein